MTSPVLCLQLYEVASRFVQAKQYPLQVEMWRPPEQSPMVPTGEAAELFVEAALGMRQGLDMMICNFNARIAHGRNGLEGLLWGVLEGGLRGVVVRRALCVALLAAS